MTFPTRPATLSFLLAEETPITDMLEGITGREPLATWNSSRTPAHRKVGGEWDTLRAVSLPTRRCLTGAGYMSLMGLEADVFSDFLQENGGTQVGVDPIAWFIRTALQALKERQTARRHAREKALVQSAGFNSYYHYRRRNEL